MSQATLEMLIQSMKTAGTLKSKAVERALFKVKREFFVPEKIKNLAYCDMPLSIGAGQTISQPTTVVLMTEALRLKRGQKILEVGAGSGWQAAIIAHIIGPKGFVWTIERIHELACLARKNLKNAGIGNVKVIEGDGSLGLPEHAPFHRIIITAAVPEIPKPLLEQLKTGGILVAPVGSIYVQEVIVLKKQPNGTFKQSSLGSFSFVPLIGRYGFR